MHGLLTDFEFSLGDAQRQSESCSEAPSLTAELAPIVGFLIAVKSISNRDLGRQTFGFEMPR